MAVENEDLARLIVTLEATTTRYYNELRKAQNQTNRSASDIEKRLTNMSTRIDKTFANLGNRLASNITGPLAGVGAALSTREIIRYADAWTEATNSIAASSDITGIQGRSLQDLRKLADDSRAGFEETVKLYTRIQRSAGAVANSEEELARATSIVNKAFKAGGAASSEMAAGILQLSQGLGSGYLQGDELRSVRENAPVLAKVIADYFGVTIAGLKELGSEGKLTSDLVFKAILSGEAQIASAFSKTNATISDGFTRVRNALIEYIGSADQSSGVTVALNAGLNALADNINVVGDAVLKLAALIAGVLVGRSLVAMTSGVLAGAASIRALTVAMSTASASGASLATVLGAAGVAAGPIAAIIGGIAVLAFQELASQSLESSTNIRTITEEMGSLEIISRSTTAELREQAKTTGELAEAQLKLNAAQRAGEGEKAVRAERDIRFGTFPDNNRANGLFFTTPVEELSSFYTLAVRANRESGSLFSTLSDGSKEAVKEISLLSTSLMNGTKGSDVVLARLREIQSVPLDEEALKYVDTLDRLILEYDLAIAKQKQLGTSTDLVNIRNELAETINYVGDLAASVTDFSSKEEEINFRKELKTLENDLKIGAISAENAEKKLIELAGISASFSNYLPGLQLLIDKLREATDEADGLKAFGIASGGNFDRGALGRAMKERRERDKARNDYIQSQRDFNALAKEERDIRTEIDRLVKDATKNGATFSGNIYDNAELRALAAENIALKESEKKGSKSDSEKFSDYLRNKELEVEAAEAELAIREKLNPLIEDYGYELAKQEFKQNALNEAKKRNQVLDEESLKNIDLLAERWATGQAAIEKLTESQNKAKESLQEWFDLGKSATRSFIDDLIEGKSAAEALSGALSQLGSKLIDLGLNSIFGTGSGGNAFGLLGQLFGLGGGIPGRASGGPVRAGQPYVVGEKRPELFVPNQDGVIIPRLPSAGSSSGNINTPVNINIDARGADNEGMMIVQNQLIRLRSELPYVIRSEVQKRAKKGW